MKPFYLVDAFEHGPFTGNPAGVVICETRQDADWMQHVAAEINQAETAFVWPEADAFGLTWFTPRTEVDLCGHATLGAAHALFTSGRVVGDTVRFLTRASGLLTVVRRESGYRMDFPALPEAPIDGDWSHLLGAQPIETRQAGDFWLACLADEETVRSLKPDLQGMEHQVPFALIVTARGKDDFDFVSRLFAPAVGIPEDPVTGSAHCALTPYWAARLDKSLMRAFQASRRGGVLGVELAGERVLLTGTARTAFEGQLLV